MYVNNYLDTNLNAQVSNRFKLAYLLHLPGWRTLMLVFVVQDCFLSSHSFIYVLPSLPQTRFIVGGHFGHWHEAL